MVIEKLKRRRSPGVDQIPTELITAGSRTIRSKIHKLNSIWNKEELPEEWKESITGSLYKRGDKTACGKCRGISLVSCVQNNILHPALKVNSICRGNYWGSSVWILTQQSYICIRQIL